VRPTVRRPAIALLAVVLVVAAGAGCERQAPAATGQPPGPVAIGDALPTPSPGGRPVRAALLPPLRAGAPAPLPAQLQAAVARARNDPALAPSLSVSVLDVATAEPLLELGADRMLLPASTAKIATAAAVLTALPPDLRLSTRVTAGGAPGVVVLVGGGDPTLAGPSARADYPAPARLAELARRARATIGTARVAKVLVDESLYSGPRLGPEWRPSYVSEGSVAPVGPLMVDGGRVRPGRQARVADPALAAGQALAALLQPGAPVTVARGRAAPGAAVLGAVCSPPVPQLVAQMLTDSDNDLAEALSRQVALAQGRPASFAGAAAAQAQVLDGLLRTVGAAPGSIALVDASGLSRRNRLQPAALTRLLTRAAAGDPQLAPILPALPVAGFDGTLAMRFRGGAAAAGAGSVRAKTGTLDGVSALAGTLRTADGRLLAFDLTADAVPPARRMRAEGALDALAAAFAACGCR